MHQPLPPAQPVLSVRDLRKSYGGFTALVYLTPLFAILLFHDLRSGEREAGRLRSLEAAAGDAELAAVR